MKHSIKKSGLLILFIILLTGCEDQLDLVNPNELSPESITTSDSDLSLQLMGCYDALQQPYTYWRFMRETDALAGVCYYHQTPFRAINQGTATPENFGYEGFWREWYQTVVRCNNLIANIVDAELTHETAMIIKGEAMFLRAFAYYHVMGFYKNAPYINYRQSFDERNVAVDTEETIKTGILNDLVFSIANLPIDQPQGKAGKAAAMALKMRVHLYFNEMAEAATLSKQIIDFNKYELFDDYSTFFTEENEVNNESLFSVAFATGIGEGERISGSFPLQPVTMSVRPIQTYVNMFYCKDGLPTGGTQLFETPLSEETSPLYDDVKFYENRDPRFETTILRDGETVPNGSKYQASRSPTGYAVEKYCRIWTSDYRADGPVDFMVIRYAEVLLARAEALLATQGVVPEIYTLINQVRGRVNMPKVQEVEETIKGSPLNTEEMLQVIKHERFVEFGVEGILWFDLKCWGDVEKTYEVITANESIDQRPYRNDKSLYWPIPQVEIDNNPNLKQHSWWIGGE